MCGLTPVLSLCLASLLAPPDWPTLIADAQAMNKSAWRHGRLRCDITFKTRPNQPESHYEVRFFWSDEKFLLKYKALEPDSDKNSAQEIDGFPLAMRPEYVVLSNDEGVHHLSPYSHSLTILRPGTPLSHYWLQVHPRHALLRCCPPMMEEGRSWVEMLTFTPTSESGKRSTITFEKIDDDIVKQTRTDPGSGRLEIRYSMVKAKGNVIDSQYFPEGGAPAIDHTTFKWKPVGKSVMVEAIESRSKQNAGKYEIDSLYRVDVLDSSLEAQDESLFNTEVFLKSIPGGTTIVDREKSLQYRLPATPESVAKKADDLIERVRSRGYLKKP